MRGRIIVLSTIIFIIFIAMAGHFEPNIFTAERNDGNRTSFMIAANSNYTTYFGSTGDEDASKVAFDNDGNTLLIGQSQSDDMPTTEGVIQENRVGQDEAYIAKFSPSGNLIFCTYLGGSNYEHITSITTDDENNIVVAGTTLSRNFPVTEDAYQTNSAGDFDGFLTKISPDGTDLIYSTYFGTTGVEWIYGVEIDESGNYLFAGWTTGTGQATVGASQTANAGAQDVFVARLSADGARLEMCSYFGGSNDDRVSLMTVDSSYNLVIAGVTESDDLPSADSGYNSTYAGDSDAYVAKISSDGSTVIFTNYIGGSGEDRSISCDIDSEGNILTTGFTESEDLSTINAIQPTYGGGLWDIQVAKFTNAGDVEFITFLGGNRSERAWEVRVDYNDDIFVAGRTYSDDYPIVNAIQTVRCGNEDACMTKISADGQTILLSTYFGGSRSDNGEGLAIDGQGHVVLTGRTNSEDLVVTGDAYQNTNAGSFDAFICHTTLDYVTATSSNSETTGSTNHAENPDYSSIIIVTGISIVAVTVILFVTIKKSRR